MRDLIAALVALLLLAVAASLATTLQWFRRRRQRARDAERALGRTIIAEIPAAEDLVLFTHDDKRFYYGDRSIDKDLIAAVRVLINGAPIAAYVSPHLGSGHAAQPTAFEDRVEGIARDRWDVASLGGGSAPQPLHESSAILAGKIEVGQDEMRLARTQVVTRLPGMRREERVGAGGL